MWPYWAPQNISNCGVIWGTTTTFLLHLISSLAFHHVNCWRFSFTKIGCHQKKHSMSYCWNCTLTQESNAHGANRCPISQCFHRSLSCPRCTAMCLGTEFGNCMCRTTDKTFFKNPTRWKHLYLTADFFSISCEGWSLKKFPGSPFVKGDDWSHVLLTHGAIDQSGNVDALQPFHTVEVSKWFICKVPTIRENKQLWNWIGIFWYVFVINNIKLNHFKLHNWVPLVHSQCCAATITIQSRTFSPPRRTPVPRAVIPNCPSHPGPRQPLVTVCLHTPVYSGYSIERIIQYVAFLIVIFT